VTYYLCIDGGGTKTTCVVADEASILARVTTAASNVIRVEEQPAREALEQAVRDACAKSGIDSAKLTRTVAGVAGVGRPKIREFVEKVLREVVDGDVIVVSDAEIALRAAFGDDPGVVVIAGTGSIALAQDGCGNTTRAGGWGWAISDEGSAPWIGRVAVAAVFRARDAGENTELEQHILRTWQLTDREQLVRVSNAEPQPDFGALLPEVAAVASAGDAIAREVFVQAGKQLARLAKLAAGHYFERAVEVRVAMSGGAFAHAPNLREAFYNGLQTQLPNATLLPHLVDPVLGALQMARRG
jgi:glucosamine kinase